VSDLRAHSFRQHHAETRLMLQADSSRYSYYLSLLLLYFLLLPMNGTVLVVWARNLIARWKVLEPFGSSHDALFVLPLLAVCELCSAGKMPDPASKRCVGCWLIVPNSRHDSDIVSLSVFTGCHGWQRWHSHARRCTSLSMAGGSRTACTSWRWLVWPFWRYGMYDHRLEAMGQVGW
jgi:hypothetical protein